MAAITPTEFSTEDLPLNVVTGTGKKRIKAFIRGTSTSTTDTINVQTYVSELSKVESVAGVSVGGSAVNGGTAANYSGNTITTEGGAGNYEIEATLQVN